MASQILFFRKNAADFERDEVIVTASEGQDTAYNVLDRSNKSAWSTDDSLDANNTTLTVNLADVRTIDSILLLKHNFKNFKVEYWNDTSLAWVLIENVTSNTAESSYFTFTSVLSSQIRITVYGTMVADDPKSLFQFIATELIGRLNGWPIVKKPVLGRDIRRQQMLSGKTYVIQGVGQYSVSLTVRNWKDPGDLTVIEVLFDSSEGFLVWPCGGEETQFSSVRKGYRLEDIFLMRCANEWSPEWADGLYMSGMVVKIDLVEVTT